MSLKHFGLVALLLVFGSTDVAVAVNRPDDAAILKGMVGKWRAPQYTLELRDDYNTRIWGPHSSTRRHVDLTIDPSGAGVLKISSAIVDARGRARRYSAMQIEVDLQISGPVDRSTTQLVPAVKVTKAEERALDGSGDHFARDDVKVTTSTTPFDPDALSIRFDTLKDDGFGETLMRQKAVVR